MLSVVSGEGIGGASLAALRLHTAYAMPPCIIYTEGFVLVMGISFSDLLWLVKTGTNAGLL